MRLASMIAVTVVLGCGGPRSETARSDPQRAGGPAPERSDEEREATPPRVDGPAEGASPAEGAMPRPPRGQRPTVAPPPVEPPVVPPTARGR
jgi:hypothetical protein